MLTAYDTSTSSPSKSICQAKARRLNVDMAGTIKHAGNTGSPSSKPAKPTAAAAENRSTPVPPGTSGTTTTTEACPAIPSIATPATAKKAATGQQQADTDQLQPSASSTDPVNPADLRRCNHPGGWVGIEGHAGHLTPSQSAVAMCTGSGDF